MSYTNLENFFNTILSGTNDIMKIEIKDIIKHSLNNFQLQIIYKLNILLDDWSFKKLEEIYLTFPIFQAIRMKVHKVVNIIKIKLFVTQTYKFLSTENPFQKMEFSHFDIGRLICMYREYPKDVSKFSKHFLFLYMQNIFKLYMFKYLKLKY